MAEINIHYERIERVWIAAVNKTKLAGCIAANGYDWDHSSFYWFKKMLHKRLRLRQKDRCCYCRRALLFNKGVVEIEHIVDKGSGKGRYKRFTFEIRNLALSCKDCNNAKGTKSVLSATLLPVDPYPATANAFAWVHPHFHKYSEHIIIHKGWVYEARNGSAQGYAVIDKCFLKDLPAKEHANRRVLVEGASDLKDAVSKAVGMVGEVGLDELCRELGNGFAKKWNSTPAKVEEAIRSIHASVQALKA